MRPRSHVFGYVHECGGGKTDILFWKSELDYTICVNASILNAEYEHVNKPVRVVL